MKYLQKTLLIFCALCTFASLQAQTKSETKTITKTVKVIKVEEDGKTVITKTVTEEDGVKDKKVNKRIEKTIEAEDIDVEVIEKDGVMKVIVSGVEDEPMEIDVDVENSTDGTVEKRVKVIVIDSDEEMTDERIEEEIEKLKGDDKDIEIEIEEEVIIEEDGKQKKKVTKKIKKKKID